MLGRTLTIGVLTTMAVTLLATAAAAEDKSPAQAQEHIYGSHLMTEQERAEHRAQMRAAKTVEEKERLRKEHHERMKLRAKDRGVTIPDEPPPRGGGKGPGGVGPGGGAGPGPGGGRGR